MADTTKSPAPSPLQSVGRALSSSALTSRSESVPEGKVADDAQLATNITAADLKSTSRPQLVQLNPNPAPTPNSNPQPKRFSTININKKFLEKNSSASGPTPIVQGALAHKPSGSTAARPQAQTIPPYSRLVTTKLTSNPPVSSVGGTGWSRPPSTASPNPSGSHSPNTDSQNLPSPAGSTNFTSNAGAPQLPKVIQPQSRISSNSQVVPSKDILSERPNKPVWGNIKQSNLVKRPDVEHDFPTAAEVAQGINSKSAESKEHVGSAASLKQSRLEEADTFRGVHLDPNAHHWDEMAEDDDNFLDGVIEFGDGRQYKIESTELPESPPPSELQQNETLSSEALSPTISISKQERFVDDFDRTWPRSATSPASARDVPLSVGPPYAASPLSSVHGSRLPQESARVLFNERSNRLEPYTNAQRSNSAQHRSHQEPSGNSRSPSIQNHANIQVWSKAGVDDQPSRSRRFSSSSSSSLFGNQIREKESFVRLDGAQTSPVMSRGNLTALPRDRDLQNGRSRRSDMGPPPLPPHAVRSHSRDGGRQAPPHLSPISTASAGRPLPRESRSQSHGTPPLNSSRFLPASPASSHASLARVSPAVSSTGLPSLSAPELNEVQKDFMQSAAARAKQRRQQEEEDREREKERARRKAIEIEQRLKSQKIPPKVDSPVDTDVTALNEESVKVLQSEVVLPNGAPQVPSVSPSQRDSLQRKPSNAEIPSRQPSDSQMTSATQAESWRNKAVSPVAEVTESPVVSFLPAPPSTEDPIETFTSEDLEVVEFSDLGKFVGASTMPENVPSMEGLARRPVNGETLYSTAGMVASGSEFSWRQNRLKSSRFDISAESQPPSQFMSSTEKDVSHEVSSFSTPETSFSASKEASNSSMTCSHSGGLKILRNHKEPAISALDDTMSRIKGVIDGMQAAETTKEISSLTVIGVETSTSKVVSTPPLGRSTSTKGKWIPPALRPRFFDRESRESDVTGTEPPGSPKSILRVIVRLPSSSRFLEPIHKKQLVLFTKPPQPRLDIFSFDLPLERTHRRDFSLNDILFGRPTGGNYRGKGKYRVSLPRSRVILRTPTSVTSQKSTNSGAFGRSTSADEVMTWRKSMPTRSEPVNKEETAVSPRPSSPAAQKPESLSDRPSSAGDSILQNKLDGSLVRPRVQPKMPVGSSVAFYRDSKIDAVKDELMSSVKFIVTSELESQEEPPKPHPSSTTATTPLPSSEAKSSNNVQETHPLESTPALSYSKADSKKSDDSPNPIPLTPPIHHDTPWIRSSLIKDSPARGPDPEHLKAVWSQTSDKAGLQSVNSLEAIADDLTAIPFTIQDVKSEDGETPPPSVPAVPSRMSLHDVTKAFQQVPTPSSSSSPKPHRTPPLATPPMSRPSNYSYLNTMRPTYPYPSPIMGHPHPPNTMYPHPIPSSPIPSRMPVNGHGPLYSQPMWVPITGPSPQNHGNMMRHMPSPYPAQLVPYPPAAVTSGLYTPQPPANMQSPPQPPTGTQVNRDRAMPPPMMSPAIAHAGPTMYGSPVMMHAPVMQVPQSHAYMVQPNRPIRTENGQLAMQHSQQPNSLSHEPSNYNPVTSFMRPSW